MKEKFNEWMSRNNMMFSAIAGETFTNADVVYTHIGLVVFLIVLGIAGNGTEMFGFDLPWFEKALNWTHRNVWTDKFDERMDLLSKLLALYPFTDIDKLVDEFKLTAGRINQLAQFYGVHKTKEKRRDINIRNGRDVFLRKYWAKKNKDKEGEDGDGIACKETKHLIYNDMELQGKIIAVMPANSGQSQRTGQTWMSQQYVLEVPGMYPKRMVFEVFGEDKIKKFNVQQGMEATVSFEIDAHEYNARWFNEVRAWDVRPAGQQQPTAQSVASTL